MYRGRDTKLDREVAIKVLPASVARDPERLARFEREAKVLASLNHPNIAQIYGVQEAEGYQALVMELVPGQTLGAQLKSGAIALDETLRLAGQMVEALSAAHEKGITHRDFKPANVMITPEGVVKVLDFGLAAVSQSSDAPTGTNVATLTMSPTSAGMIMGTAPYMSPEQARGNQADRRSDIFSFGVVLYEMLTGKQLFNGETVSDILASVLKDAPNLEDVPEQVRPLLQRCLQKDPKKSLQSIGDWDLLLDRGTPGGEAFQAALSAPSRSRFGAVSALAAAFALAAMALGIGYYRATRPIEKPLMRLNVDLGPDAVAGANITVAISPDGKRIAFPMRGPGGKVQLATRLLDQATPTLLSGTDNAADPLFSPDGQWIGFFAEGKLKKISVLGGAAVALCDATALRGASWGEDGNIIATLGNTSGTGLSRIPDAGGPPQTLTTPLDKGEVVHRWPQILPGGNAVLFSGAETLANYDTGSVEVLALKNGALKAGEIKILVRGGYSPHYLPGSSFDIGHLVYLHEGVLMGVAFDPVKLALRGTPVPLLEGVAGNMVTGGGQFEVSGTGSLVYLAGKSGSAKFPIVWMDSSGKTEPLLANPSTYYSPRFSPDGNWLALSMNPGKGADIYIYDWRHDAMSRLTFTGNGNYDPVWAPDGKHIAYDAADGMWWIRADGAGEPQRLLEGKAMYSYSFSPDGKRLSYFAQGPETKYDILTLPLDLSDPEHPKPGKTEAFLHTPANEMYGTFSPDGRWMAYQSDESGTPEVYVRGFGNSQAGSSQGSLGGKWQISSGGGNKPVWSRDGRELFFANSEGRLTVSECAAQHTTQGDSFTYSKPRLWADKQLLGGNRLYYDVVPDGKRFAVFAQPESEEKQGNVHVTFLLNFFDEVARKVPVK